MTDRDRPRRLDDTGPQAARKYVHEADRWLQRAVHALRAHAEQGALADPAETRLMAQQLRFVARDLVKLLGHAGDDARQSSQAADLTLSDDLTGLGLEADIPAGERPAAARKLAGSAARNLADAHDLADQVQACTGRAAEELGAVHTAGRPRKETP